MTWSSTGSAATYPTTAPSPAPGTGAATFALVFRADPNSGIVYVTGSLAYNGGPASSTTNILSAPLASVYRPLTPVVIAVGAASGVGSPPALTVNPDGTANVAQFTTGTTYAVRAFYFSNVTPG